MPYCTCDSTGTLQIKTYTKQVSQAHTRHHLQKDNFRHELPKATQLRITENTLTELRLNEISLHVLH